MKKKHTVLFRFMIIICHNVFFNSPENSSSKLIKFVDQHFGELYTNILGVPYLFLINYCTIYVCMNLWEKQAHIVSELSEFVDSKFNNVEKLLLSILNFLLLFYFCELMIYVVSMPCAKN